MDFHSGYHENGHHFKAQSFFSRFEIGFVEYQRMTGFSSS
jgi:hypothetical protein